MIHHFSRYGWKGGGVFVVAALGATGCAVDLGTSEERPRVAPAALASVDFGGSTVSFYEPEPGVVLTVERGVAGAPYHLRALGNKSAVDKWRSLAPDVGVPAPLLAAQQRVDQLAERAGERVVGDRVKTPPLVDVPASDDPDTLAAEDPVGDDAAACPAQAFTDQVCRNQLAGDRWTRCLIRQTGRTTIRVDDTNYIDTTICAYRGNIQYNYTYRHW
jgi:hypothetical protein